MKILVINTGSSSLKFRLFDYDSLKLIAKGLIERIGEAQPFFKTSWTGGECKANVTAKNHREAFSAVITQLTSPDCGVIKDVSEIKGVGHRVVHGAEKFAKTVLIDQEVVNKLQECIPLAPLHNPPNLMGISAALEVMGNNVPQVGVFDTAFHQTLPREAFLYALPIEYYEKYRIRRYGFHGTSHKFVSLRLYEILNQAPDELKIVSCHLGNGASLAAIKNGISVDTSMGMTPLEGVVMGTRCGDLDPALPMFIMNNYGKTADEMDKILNKQSGLLGLSGISNDIRDVETACKNGDEKAITALDVYCYRIKKYIGAYAAVMGGITDIIFTAGVGERDPIVREKVLSGLEFLGVKLDKKANEKTAEETLLTTEDSRVRAWIIPTDEELMIARETRAVIESLVKR